MSLSLTNSTTGKIFQYPLSGITAGQNCKKYKEDEPEQPYYKFVKVRKIFLNGKGLYELKLVQYCFVNSTLPLFNAVPLNMMLTESEEKRRRRLSSLKDDQGDDSNIIACGRKKRKYVVRKERKKKNPNPYRKINFKKKLRKLDTIIKRINTRNSKEAFKILKNCTINQFEEHLPLINFHKEVISGINFNENSCE